VSYCTIDDLIAEGVDGDPEDEAFVARATAAIREACALIDRATGQWFEKRTKAIRVSGTGSGCLHLPVPIVQGDDPITAISTGLDTDDEEEVDLDDVRIFNGDDDRDNPKIRALGWAWPKGEDNVEVTGSFGFVEYDEGEGSDPVPTWTTPPEIAAVAKLLAIRNLPRKGAAYEWAERQAFRLVAESTRGRSNTFAALPATGGPTGDPDIDGVLARYRAPVGVVNL